MNRANRLESILRDNGGAASLSTIKAEAESRGFFDVHHHLTAATSELRAELHGRVPLETLVWRRGKTPGKGTYTIMRAEMRDGVIVPIPIQPEFTYTETKGE